LFYIIVIVAVGATVAGARKRRGLNTVLEIEKKAKKHRAVLSTIDTADKRPQKLPDGQSGKQDRKVDTVVTLSIDVTYGARRISEDEYYVNPGKGITSETQHPQRKIKMISLPPGTIMSFEDHCYPVMVDALSTINVDFSIESHNIMQPLPDKVQLPGETSRNPKFYTKLVPFDGEGWHPIIDSTTGSVYLSLGVVRKVGVVLLYFDQMLPSIILILLHTLYFRTLKYVLLSLR
jgi:hypothetical protein